ncbi:hypothetical protein BHM03_00041651 [Ensete ventricosum]|nr:hypothetical protein BHM03_00041651 [Ensete ventricosum]
MLIRSPVVLPDCGKLPRHLPHHLSRDKSPPGPWASFLLYIHPTMTSSLYLSLLCGRPPRFLFLHLPCSFPGQEPAVKGVGDRLLIDRLFLSGGDRPRINHLFLPRNGESLGQARVSSPLESAPRQERAEECPRERK